jgi:hypothetical protein
VGLRDLRLLCDGGFKAPKGLAYSLAHFGKPLRTEDKKNNREDDDKLLSTHAEHKEPPKKYWNTGILEEWNNGAAKTRNSVSSLDFPNIPIFRLFFDFFLSIHVQAKNP